MKKQTIITIVVLAALVGLDPIVAIEPSQERTDKILRHIDDLWRGNSSYAVVTMQVKTAHYTRTLRMKAWSKGKEKTLVRIESPLKEKGTATLKSGKSMYSYLPRTDRSIRLTSGMMMGSWMGSHFTNDDLVQESRREDDFESKLSFEGLRDGVDIIEFTLIPNPDAAVVWGKVVLLVRAKDYMPIAEDFYDEDMALTRSFTFTEIKTLAGKQLPSVMKVIPADKPDEYTQIVYEKLELDIDIKDSFFSLANLKKR